MTSTAIPLLQQVGALLHEVCASLEVDRQFDALDRDELVSLLCAAGAVQRRLEAVLTVATAAVAGRDTRMSDERVSARAGCRDVTELLRRTLRVDTGTARRFVHAADAVQRDVEVCSGEMLPARFDALRQALQDGELSATGVLAAIAPLQRAASRIGVHDMVRADRVLADAARGLDLADEQGSPGPAPSTDELSALAQHIVLLLDPDGAEPDDAVGERRRALSLGRLRNGVVPVAGQLLPEVAGQLQRLIDAIGNPAADRSGSQTATDDSARVRFVDEGVCDGTADSDDPPDPVDPRTPAQRRHDAFAAILTAAAASHALPTLGGAAPTLVVSITAEDYVHGTGRATIEGTGWDVPVSVARHTACAGGVQRVLFDGHGQIVGIGTTARIFTAVQRRAITLRDHECLIPGCHVPATWCEIHHVREWADGGPTHTSNGVALCWHHHRTLDISGWRIRMSRGVPEIRGPSWWDPRGGWHRPRIRHGTGRDLAARLGAAP